MFHVPSTKSFLGSRENDSCFGVAFWWILLYATLYSNRIISPANFHLFWTKSDGLLSQLLFEYSLRLTPHFLIPMTTSHLCRHVLIYPLQLTSVGKFLTCHSAFSQSSINFVLMLNKVKFGITFLLKHQIIESGLWFFGQPDIYAAISFRSCCFQLVFSFKKLC